MGQGSHLAVLMSAKNLTQGAGGHLTIQTVDIDALLFMILTHGLV